jgi:hypothetical protein
MNFQKIVALHHFFSLLFCNIFCPINVETPSLMHEYFRFVMGSCLSRIKFNSNFLIDYYNTSPLSCLEHVYSMRSFAFDKLFFDIICHQYTSYFLYLPKDHSGNFMDVVVMCDRIKTMIRNLLNKPCNSKAKMEKNFSTIEALIKFIKRYLVKEYMINSGSTHKLSHCVKTWEMVMRTLTSISYDGTVDYNHFFLILRQVKEMKDIKFHEYEERNSYNYVLFATYIAHVVNKRDFTIFQFDHPDLPLLLGFILDNVNDNGRCCFPNFDPELFYFDIKSFFCFQDRRPVLSYVLNEKMQLVCSVKRKLNIKNRHSDSISHLLRHFRSKLPESLNEEQLNLLWQMEGLAVIQRFLKNHNFESRNPLNQYYFLEL